MKSILFHIIGIRFLGALTASVLMSACTAPAFHARTLPPLLGQAQHEIADVDLLGLSSEMTEFIQQHVPESTSPRQKAFALTYATLDPYLMNFSYDPSLTLIAEETFRKKTGNCLSFSSMFIAMARASGLEAWYQEVEIPTQWNAVNDTLLVSLHVNAVVADRYSEFQVDISRPKKNSLRRVRKISDREARAQYYNNMGGDALIENDLAMAYAYFAKALQTKPDLAFVWSNLGVTYKRNDQPEDAKLAYTTALEQDPDLPTALNNLYSILTEQGNVVEAQAVQRQVERNRRKNPYYLHYQSVLALDEQRYEDAIELLGRAIKLDEEEYRFHFALARSLYLSGEKNKAGKSLAQAKLLAPSNAEIADITLPELSIENDF